MVQTKILLLFLCVNVLIVDRTKAVFIVENDTKNLIDTLSLISYNASNTMVGLSLPALLECPLCRGIVELGKSYIIDHNIEQLLHFSKFICKTIWSIVDEDVCISAIRLNMPIAQKILEINRNLSSHDICHFYMTDKCDKHFKGDSWSIDDHSSIPKKYYEPDSTNMTPLNIIHITDIHYDPDYKEKSNAVCSRPMCCRDIVENLPVEKQAGYWGDYRMCDVPMHSLRETLKHIQTQHKKIDAIYFTGDITSHNTWNTTYEQIKDSIKTVYQLFHEYFPNVTVYPILGNHEAQPCNNFAPLNVTDPNLSIHWLYNLSASEWSKWFVNDTKALETIKFGGFYTTLLQNRKFRVIALNNNVAYKSNLWEYLTTVDPYNQLQWLSDQLLAAETNQEFVHILMHVPVGGEDSEVTWSREFRKIVSRFSHVIKGIFTGHTHYCEMTVLYDTDKPLATVWNGGSLTPYSNVNPNYRLFYVNDQNFDLEDFEEWYYDLDESNKMRIQNWKIMYTFKQEYGAKSLRANDMHQVIQKIGAVNDTSLILKYIRYKGKNSTVYFDDIIKKCDRKYLKQELCRLVTAQHGDDTQCDLFFNNY